MTFFFRQKKKKKKKGGLLFDVQNSLSEAKALTRHRNSRDRPAGPKSNENEDKVTCRNESLESLCSRRRKKKKRRTTCIRARSLVSYLLGTYHRETVIRWLLFFISLFIAFYILYLIVGPAHYCPAGFSLLDPQLDQDGTNTANVCRMQAKQACGSCRIYHGWLPYCGRID